MRHRGAMIAAAFAAGLLGLALLPAAAAVDLLPLRPDADRPLAPVPIGKPGDYKDYVRVDRGTRIPLRGPGKLTFYVRAHADSESAAPETVWVSLSGVVGVSQTRWSRAVEPSPVSEYADGRLGVPSSGARVSVDIPAGIHTAIVMAASDTGGPVFATFYYDGPPPPTDLVTPARAAPRPTEPPEKLPSPWAFSGNFALEFIYDDNICRYSDATLATFQSGTDPDQFAIETYDDLVLNTALDGELSHKKLIFGKRTRLRARYQYWQYVRNDIKSNDEINLRLRQHARRYDYFEFNYTFAPNNYIKELRDRPPYVSRTVDREYLHFSITRNAFAAAYRWRATDWLALKFEGERVLRFYNRPFLENDLWEWNGEINAYLGYRRLDFWLAYKYSDVAARGYDEVGETLETSDNDGDGSYEKDAYRIRVTYGPKRSPYRPDASGTGLTGAFAGLLKGIGAQIDRGLVRLNTYQLYGEFYFTRQFYTSERPLYIDPLHVGRLDEQRQFRFGWVSRSLWRGLALDAGWRYTVRTADAPAGLIGEDDPSEEKDYTGSRYWIAVNYPLG